jgi:hypothetical protein
MKDIYEVIEAVKLRPEMYAGSRTISDVYKFLAGVHFGFMIDQKKKEHPEFREFHTWIREKLELEPLSVHYAHTLLEYYKNDEEKSLQAFFELISEYKSTQS